jgi:hypothetical protein
MGNPIEVGQFHLRVARPTVDLAAVVRCYCDGPGFKVLVSKALLCCTANR